MKRTWRNGEEEGGEGRGVGNWRRKVEKELGRGRERMKGRKLEEEG